MPRADPTVTAVLLRGLALRCPACGLGHVFERGIHSARICSVCGFRLERCLGHWIGGNEISVLVTFTAGVAAFVACALVPALGIGPASVWIATAFTAVFGLASYRPSRGLFFAIDYLIDRSIDGASPPASPGPGPYDRVGPFDSGPDAGSGGPSAVRRSLPSAAPSPAPSPPLRPFPEHACGARPLPAPTPSAESPPLAPPAPTAAPRSAAPENESSP